MRFGGKPLSVIRAFTTLSLWTMISRIFGFMRDILFANILGAGLVTDAFFIAFKFPNLFRRLFGEGAMNAAFVPLYTRKMQSDGPSAARLFAAQVSMGVMLFIVLLTGVAIIAMPMIMMVQAHGFMHQQEKFDLTVDMARIIFPYLAFMVLAALLSGMLNSNNRFAAGAAAPVILNVVLIITLGLIYYGVFANPGIALAWAVCLAGLLQAALLMFAAYRAGILFFITRPRLTPDVKKMLVLFGPGVFGAGVTQINVVIGDILATLLGEGAVSYLYYADRLTQLPLGVIGVAVGVALLPAVTRQIHSNDQSGANTTMNHAIAFSMVLILPATIALIILPDLIIITLFQRGAFDLNAAYQTARALQAFALGLPAFVLIKALSTGFFAHEDTKTPVKIAVWIVGANCGLAYILMQELAHQGIALATALTAWLQAGLFYVILHRRKVFTINTATLQRLLRILAASIGMAISLIVVQTLLNAQPFLALSNTAEGLRILVLIGVVLMGSGTYLVFCLALRVISLHDLLRMIARRNRAR